MGKKKQTDPRASEYVVLMFLPTEKKQEARQQLIYVKPRVRKHTAMRKKTMQVREKPLVYPRYPIGQTLH